MKPAIPVTDPRFAYTRSFDTDLRAKFAKIRAAQADEAARARAGIVDIKRRTK